VSGCVQNGFSARRIRCAQKGFEAGMGLAFLTGIAGFHAQIIDNLVGCEVETSGEHSNVQSGFNSSVT
jgi:hypothetical protein